MNLYEKEKIDTIKLTARKIKLQFLSGGFQTGNVKDLKTIELTCGHSASDFAYISPYFCDMTFINSNGLSRFREIIADGQGVLSVNYKNKVYKIPTRHVLNYTVIDSIDIEYDVFINKKAEIIQRKIFSDKIIYNPYSIIFVNTKTNVPRAWNIDDFNRVYLDYFDYKK